MKEGDIIEWEGVRRKEHGMVEVSKEYGFIVRMDSGHTFQLGDLRYSKSAKLISK